MGREPGEPLLAETPVDHVEQRPDRSFCRPRVVGRVDPRGRGDRLADQPAGEGELDVRAHAVAAG